jgi:hypothetical protein
MSIQTSPPEYLLLFRGTDWWDKLSAEELQKLTSEFNTWFDGIVKKGILKGAQPLFSTGKTISGKGGIVVADGPFAEAKETIGGYFLLQVDSLEEAVAIAQTHPCLGDETSIEVRPVASICPMCDLYYRSVEDSKEKQELAGTHA